MRFLIVVALASCAMDCAAKALGRRPQFTLPDTGIWFWWFPAATFGLCALSVLFYGVSA